MISANLTRQVAGRSTEPGTMGVVTPPKGTQDMGDCRACPQGAGHTWGMGREQTGTCGGCARPGPPTCPARPPGAGTPPDRPGGSRAGGRLLWGEEDCSCLHPRPACRGARGWTQETHSFDWLVTCHACRFLPKAPGHPGTPAPRHRPSRGCASREPTLGGRPGAGILNATLGPSPYPPPPRDEHSERGEPELSSPACRALPAPEGPPRSPAGKRLVHLLRATRSACAGAVTHGGPWAVRGFGLGRAGDRQDPGHQGRAELPGRPHPHLPCHLTGPSTAHSCRSTRSPRSREADTRRPTPGPPHTLPRPHCSPHFHPSPFTGINRVTAFLSSGVLLAIHWPEAGLGTPERGPN